MERIKYIIISLLLMVLIPLNVQAGSGSITVSGTSNAVVGNKVTVTVTLASSTPIGSWQMDLNYDRSFLQLTSSSAEANGTRMANSVTSGISKKTYTFTFKTLKKGNTSVKVDSYLAYAFADFSQISLSSTGKSIKIITQEELEASYSKDNNLASLAVDGFEITPAFNKDTLEYSVIVPEDTKQINISAKASDSKSSINGIGSHDVTSGTNTFAIVVKAENGSEKTYTLTVDVKDANPINVEVDGESFTVVKIKENLPSVSAYQEYTVKIGEFDIPAFKNNNTNLVLVGLKNASGDIKLFIYDEEKNSYQKYQEIGVNKITIYPMDTDEAIKGYEKSEVEIDGINVNCFSYDGDTRFVIIYGINVETGEKGFYLYDKETQTVIKYNDNYIKDLENKLNTYNYVIIGFSVALVLMLSILLLVIFKKPKKGKKNKTKTKKEVKNDNKSKKKDENEIIELD